MEHHWIRCIRSADLSPKSKKMYVDTINSICQLDPSKTLEDIVLNPKRVMGLIFRKAEAPKTRKLYIATVKALAKHAKLASLPEYEQALKVWDEQFRSLDKFITEEAEKAEPSERERRQWVEWPEVLNMEKTLAGDEATFGSTSHLLLAMYTHVPPQRQDYGDVLLVLHQPQTPGQNYLLLPKSGSGSGRICLHDRKTARTMGVYHGEIPPALVSIIVQSLKLAPRKFLFERSEGGGPFLKTQFRDFSNKVLIKLFKKQMGVSTLRHSFISALDYNRLSPAQLKAIAYAMGHDVAQQQLYRRLGMTPPTGASEPAQPPLRASAPGI